MNINTYNLLRKGGEWREDNIPFSGGVTLVLEFLTCVLNIKVSIAILFFLENYCKAAVIKP